MFRKPKAYQETGVRGPTPTYLPHTGPASHGEGSEMQERAQPATEPPVITNAEETREALTRTFLAQADAGHDDANDELVAALLAWRRR
ncbi:MAG: hypothetical protein ACRDQA_20315, partial [Nocardioidaceae bacterium]